MYIIYYFLLKSDFDPSWPLKMSDNALSFIMGVAFIESPRQNWQITSFGILLNFDDTRIGSNSFSNLIDLPSENCILNVIINRKLWMFTHQSFSSPWDMTTITKIDMPCFVDVFSSNCSKALTTSSLLTSPERLSFTSNPRFLINYLIFLCQ